MTDPEPRPADAAPDRRPHVPELGPPLTVRSAQGMVYRMHHVGWRGADGGALYGLDEHPVFHEADYDPVHVITDGGRTIEAPPDNLFLRREVGAHAGALQECAGARGLTGEEQDFLRALTTIARLLDSGLRVKRP